VDRTANIAWSPQAQVPIYLAAGTAAQQLDASFSTNSNLEIYGLNLSESGHDMPCLASVPVDQRYHKLVWGACGMGDRTMPSGLLVGGADRGIISMYDAAKLIKGEDNALVFTKDKHTGPVGALDFNPFQSNLLASGGSESELYIWDVNKPGNPMTPGAKNQPLDDVRCVAWNRQVQHILASTFSTRCVVWDLKKNEPIIKVSDSTSRMRFKVVAWHPEVATQLCLASDDDHTPVIQIWDLRLASSPLKTLEGHHKGILSVAWCQSDPDLLMSCGKDNRLLVWNPNSTTGEIVAELPTSNQWSFDVSWCPRNPGVIASASFDGRVSVYSLMGGQQQVQPNNKVTDSFGPGLGEIPGQNMPTPQVTCQLKAPPKWLRKPCGASFGFGGKLVTCDTVAGEKPKIYLSKVITEPQLVDASLKLETSLSEGNYQEFCQAKLATVGAGDQAKIWQFIGASFGGQCDQEFLQLLGVQLAELSAQLRTMLKPVKQNGHTEGLAESMSGMDLNAPKDDFDLIAAQAVPEEPVKPTTLDNVFSLKRDTSNPDGQLTVALLAGDIELAVDIAIKQNRFAEALILSIRGGQELLIKTRAKYFQEAAIKGGSESLALLEAVAMDDWTKLVENSNLDSWKEVLAAVLTYTDQNTKYSLAGKLGDRLASQPGSDSLVFAIQCYLVAGDLDKLVSTWLKFNNSDNSNPKSLQDLVELAVVSRAAVSTRGLARVSSPGGELSVAMGKYATLLAGQGSLATAMSYLPDDTVAGDKDLSDLKDRLQKALAAPATAAQTQPQRMASRGHQNTGRTVSGASYGSRQSFNHGDSRRQSVEPNFSNFNTGLPSQPQPPVSSMSQPSTMMPSYPNMMTPAVSSYHPTPSQPSMMTPTPPSSMAAPPAVPTFEPPPPSSEASVSSSSSSNPLLKRGRAVDPSIAAGGGGGGYGQYGYMQPQSPPHAGYPYKDQFNDPSQASVSQPSYFNPAADAGMLAPSSTYTHLASQPAPALTGHIPDQPSPGFTPMVSNGSGWNDPPPMMTKSGKKLEPSVTSTVNDPITHPLYGAAPEPTPAPPSGPGGWAGFQPAPAPVGGFNQQPVSGYQGFQPAEPVPPANQPAAVPPPVEKAPPAPIPAEHQVIQDTLENLRAKCQQVSAHPQVRRKLDDVSHKLDILYDKLRNQTLSPATLQGLHTILQHIWAYDYQSCMQVISGLIAGGSFAEMSDFMPGVKVLLQLAQQQGVYVEYQK